MSTGGSAGTDGGVSDECTLTVLVTGELPGPSFLVGYPAIVATNDGFVVAYRSQDENATMHSNMVFVSDAGAMSAPTAVELPDCVAYQAKEGVGLGFDGSQGLLVTYAPCAATPEFALMAFDSQGQSVGSTTVPAPAVAGLTTLPLAPGRTKGEYDFLYEGAGSDPMQKVVVQAFGLKSSPEAFGTDLQFAEIVATPEIRAQYGLQQLGASTKVRVDANQSETFEPVGELDLPSTGVVVPGVVAWKNRVAAAVSRPTEVTWTAGELVGSTLTNIGGGTIARPWTTLAWAVLGDRLLLAVTHDGDIELTVFDDADGQLASTSTQVKKIATSYVPGDELVIAAARARIAVAWVKDDTPPAFGSTGGWALLSCGN